MEDYNINGADVVDLPETDVNTKIVKATDRVNHPSHYNTNNPIIRVKCNNCGQTHKIPLECIDVIRDMPSWKGNAIKYLWRVGLKQEEGLSNKEKTIEDLNKAIWYINDKIKQLKQS